MTCWRTTNCFDRTQWFLRPYSETPFPFFPLWPKLFWISKEAVGFPPYLSTTRTHGIGNPLTTGIWSDHRKEKYAFNMRQRTQGSPHMGLSETPEMFSYRNRCWHETNASFVYILVLLNVIAISLFISPVFCSKRFPRVSPFHLFSLERFFCSCDLLESIVGRLDCHARRGGSKTETQDIGRRVITFLPLIVPVVRLNYVDDSGSALFLGNIDSRLWDLGREGQSRSPRLEKQQHRLVKPGPKASQLSPINHTQAWGGSDTCWLSVWSWKWLVESCCQIKSLLCAVRVLTPARMYGIVRYQNSYTILDLFNIV